MSERLFKIVFGILIIAVAVAAVMFYAYFLLWLGMPTEPLTQLVNAGAGAFDSIKKLVDAIGHWSGIFTLAAAIYAGRKAVQVSRDRREEAEAAEFRDYMKWVVENIDLNDSDPNIELKTNFGLNILYKYVLDPPDSLNETDLEIAYSILDEIEGGSDSVEDARGEEVLTQEMIQSIADEVLGKPSSEND